MITLLNRLTASRGTRFPDPSCDRSRWIRVRNPPLRLPGSPTGPRFWARPWVTIDAEWLRVTFVLRGLSWFGRTSTRLRLFPRPFSTKVTSLDLHTNSCRCLVWFQKNYTEEDPKNLEVSKYRSIVYISVVKDCIFFFCHLDLRNVQKRRRQKGLFD